MHSRQLLALACLVASSSAFVPPTLVGTHLKGNVNPHLRTARPHPSPRFSSIKRAPLQLQAIFGLGEKSKTKKVGVIGASGGVGRLAVAYLIEKGCDVRAIVRNKERASELLPATIEFRVGDTVDPTLGDGLAAAIEGVDALIVATGTTAFPTDKWGPNKENNPQAVDDKGVKNVVAAVCEVNGKSGKKIKKISLLSSIGIERRADFPFSILNWCGVLDAKYAGEQAVAAAAESAGYTYAFARLGRLVGGPYTGTPDVASLLQLDEGNNQAITMVRRDPNGFAGDLSRKQGAMALVQAALNDKNNIAFAIVNRPGPEPAQEDWDLAFEFTEVEKAAAPSFSFLIEDLVLKAKSVLGLEKVTGEAANNIVSVGKKLLSDVGSKVKTMAGSAVSKRDS